jgi:hypothetical protein
MLSKPFIKDAYEAEPGIDFVSKDIGILLYLVVEICLTLNMYISYDWNHY